MASTGQRSKTRGRAIPPLLRGIGDVLFVEEVDGVVKNGHRLLVKEMLVHPSAVCASCMGPEVRWCHGINGRQSRGLVGVGERHRLHASVHLDVMDSVIVRIGRAKLTKIKLTVGMVALPLGQCGKVLSPIEV